MRSEIVATPLWLWIVLGMPRPTAQVSTMEQAIAEELQVTLIDVLGVELFRGTRHDVVVNHGTGGLSAIGCHLRYDIYIGRHALYVSQLIFSIIPYLQTSSHQWIFHVAVIRRQVEN
jgi:hypothetical protein